MKSTGTYFQNDSERPVVYGEVELTNPLRLRLRGEEPKAGVLVQPVLIGFCGTDHELMQMGRAGKLSAKFPQGHNRLINGHEGVVWVPSQNRFAIVLIRGGDSVDPTRYTEDESYFEYGCDQADGLFCDEMYVHPDMLLDIPEGCVKGGKLALSFAKKMIFADPFACMLFQLERMEDLGGAHNFRQAARRHGCSLEEARVIAADELFARTVVFGLGTTGMFIGDIIRRKHPNAQIVFVGLDAPESDKVRFALQITGGTYIRNDFAAEEQLAQAICRELGGRASLFIAASGTSADHRIAFEHRVLGCNGLYNSFSLGPKVTYDTMPFGFENHLIFGSINFRQDHMEQAIQLLATSRYDEIVGLMERDVLARDPVDAYENLIFCKGAPTKTAVIWRSEFVDINR